MAAINEAYKVLSDSGEHLQPFCKKPSPDDWFSDVQNFEQDMTTVTIRMTLWLDKEVLAAASTTDNMAASKEEVSITFSSRMVVDKASSSSSGTDSDRWAHIRLYITNIAFHMLISHWVALPIYINASTISNSYTSFHANSQSSLIDR